MNDRNRPKPEWIHDKDFTHPDSDVVVRVTKTEGHRPRYSLQVGRPRKVEGREVFVTHLPVFVQTEHGQVKSVTKHFEVVSELLRSAHEYITTSAQQAENAFMDKRIARESRGMQQAEQRPGLKKLGKVYART